MDEGERAVHSAADHLPEPETVGGQTPGQKREAETSKLALSGIFRIPDILDDLRIIYRKGLDRGESPGWSSFGELYRVKRGMMSIVTGIPSSGKSEFVDAMMVNLAAQCNWKFALFSPENYPVSLHVIKIAEKFSGKQYKNENPAFSMNSQDIVEAIEFVGRHFTWIYPDDEKETVNLDTILMKARTIKEMEGLDGMVIDPWNELEHDRGGKSMTEHISECLTKARRFARKHDIHLWIVAHPQKMPKNKDGGYDPPTPYDISDSAHWRNKADFCLCVHRANLQENKVAVYVQKVKFKHLGKVGMGEFAYTWHNGRFSEPNQHPCPY